MLKGIGDIFAAPNLTDLQKNQKLSELLKSVGDELKDYPLLTYTDDSTVKIPLLRALAIRFEDLGDVNSWDQKSIEAINTILAKKER